MKLTTKGQRTPKTLQIIKLRSEGKPITEIAKVMGCTRQWVDFVLKRDGDPLDAVDKSPIDINIGRNIIKVKDIEINEQGDDITGIVRQ